MSWPSFSQENLLNSDGKQSILLKASKLSARLFYPAPSVLRFEPAGHLSTSPVISWQITHLSQSVSFSVDVLGC